MSFGRKSLVATCLLLMVSLTPNNASSAQKIGAGVKCSEIGKKVAHQGKRFTCIQRANNLIWSKGVVIKRAVPKKTVPAVVLPQETKPAPEAPKVQEVQLPQEGSRCKKAHEKVVNADGYMKCSWTGGPRENYENQFVWRYFTVQKTSSSKSNNYPTTPVEGAVCARSGDTFNVLGGILECRWVSGKKLQWIRINSVTKTFTNTESPVSIDVCKLQNSASSADRSGRNSGAGLVGFPLINTDKNGMNLKGKNEVLIVPVDFTDFPGEVDPKVQLAFDKKWMSDWYNYFSNGQSQFNITSIDKWVRMPGARSNYPTDGKSGVDPNSNRNMGNQGQPFIDEISKEVDLRKFSTVYMYFPDGELKLSDLIVRNHIFKVKEGEHRLNFFSWGGPLEAMETLKWSYYIHETLHDFNIIGHAPGNGWPLGMMSNQSGISQAINPYEQFLFDWLPSSQIYCDDIQSLKPVKISLSPIEREDRQTKMAIIKLSPTKAIVVESHGIDKWSSLNFGDRNFPPGFYSIMAYIVDLDKAVAPPVLPDGQSISNDDWAWAVWQKVNGEASNEFNVSVGDRRNLAEYVAVLGDSFIIEGVRIKFVATGDYETIEISRS